MSGECGVRGISGAKLRTPGRRAEATVVHGLDIPRCCASVQHIEVQQLLGCIHVHLVSPEVGCALAIVSEID